MKKEYEKKLEYIRNNKEALGDGPIEGTCHFNGAWETTVFEFLDDLICNEYTYLSLPEWHMDFQVEPVIDALYRSLLED